MGSVFKSACTHAHTDHPPPSPFFAMPLLLPRSSSDYLPYLWCLLAVCVLIPVTATKSLSGAKLEPPSTTAPPPIVDASDRDDGDDVPDDADRYQEDPEEIILAHTTPPPGPLPVLASSVPGRQPMGEHLP
jgi:hypothetical protein